MYGRKLTVGDEGAKHRSLEHVRGWPVGEATDELAELWELAEVDVKVSFMRSDHELGVLVALGVMFQPEQATEISGWEVFASVFSGERAVDWLAARLKEAAWAHVVEVSSATFEDGFVRKEVFDLVVVSKSILLVTTVRTHEKVPITFKALSHSLNGGISSGRLKTANGRGIHRAKVGLKTEGLWIGRIIVAVDIFCRVGGYILVWLQRLPRQGRWGQCRRFGLKDPGSHNDSRE